MKSLKHGVEEYLNYRNSLGFTLIHDRLILNQFVSYMVEKRAPYVTCELAIAFSKLNPHASRVWWAVRLAIIKRFTDYWRQIDPRTEVLTQCFGSSTYRRKTPYIYSANEIKKILTCCMLSSSPYEVERYSYFIWFGLMAITGMRTGEVARLRRSDLNLEEGIITIHNSKFRKSRLIPLHKSTTQALTNYLIYRDRHISNFKTKSLFIDHSGVTLSAIRVRTTFRALLIKIGIQRTPSGHPRLMDFRHTFAVNTLVRWHRRQVNIDQHIPVLLTYLGHSHLRHTYWYITTTPKLLKLFGSRLNKNGGVL